MISVALAVALSTHNIDYISTEVEVLTSTPVVNVEILEVSSVDVEVSEVKSIEVDIETPDILTDTDIIENKVEVGDCNGN